MPLIAAVILASAAAWSEREGYPWPLAEKAFAAACPHAEQEELITCAYELMALSDRRIEWSLCQAAPADCKTRFAAFTNKRRAAIRGTLDNEGSVVSQLEAAWSALEQTLAFEQATGEGAKRSH